MDQPDKDGKALAIFTELYAMPQAILQSCLSLPFTRQLVYGLGPSFTRDSLSNQRLSRVSLHYVKVNKPL